MLPVLMMIGAMALLGVGVLAGHIHHQHPAATQQTTTTTGETITLKGSVLASSAPKGCASAANGIKDGARVNVLDLTGAIVGTTQLGQGLPANHGGCTWSWSLVSPIVSGYEIQVADLPVATVNRTTLATQAWNFYENDTTDSSKLINIESGV